MVVPKQTTVLMPAPAGTRPRSLRYAGGAWRPVDPSKPNPYGALDGRQTAAVPRALGTVCGIQEDRVAAPRAAVQSSRVQSGCRVVGPP